ncbi:MAG TPA: DUF2085 domain-containing protein [Thermoanaerobaculia bacterium]|nr:DUF2085 domain-containing protein [Thermoanaerobaculia bacterium]
MTRETRLVGGMLGLVSLGILAAVTACTGIIAAGASPKLRILFRVMCHGLESRCLILWDTPMPICSRCFAIYAGLLLGVVAFAGVAVLRSHSLPLIGLIALTVPLALDGVSQAAGLRESFNELRTMTGILAGWGFAVWCLGAVESSARARQKILKFETLTPDHAARSEP